jgi:Holliday junction DNA helicase RuvB
MEDFELDWVIGQGRGAHGADPLQSFTLVGATTRQAWSLRLLRARFGISLRFDYYTRMSLGVIRDPPAYST